MTVVARLLQEELRNIFIIFIILLLLLLSLLL